LWSSEEKNKTPGAAWAAYALKKPIVALPKFGGASQEIWNDLASEYQAILDKDNFNSLSDLSCSNDDLRENAILACDKLVTEAKKKAFSDKEIFVYSSLALAFGLAAFFLAVEAHHLVWWRVFAITILSVLAGGLFSPVSTGEKKQLISVLPSLLLLVLVILGVVGLGDKILEGVIDPHAEEKAAHLLRWLFGVGLLSGYSAQTSLTRWLAKLGIVTGGHE
jgi:hypothetical protein